MQIVIQISLSPFLTSTIANDTCFECINYEIHWLMIRNARASIDWKRLASSHRHTYLQALSMLMTCWISLCNAIGICSE